MGDGWCMIVVQPKVGQIRLLYLIIGVSGQLWSRYSLHLGVWGWMCGRCGHNAGVISLSQMMSLNLNFKSQFLMSRQLTEFLLRLAQEETVGSGEGLQAGGVSCPLSSSQIINRIYSTINSERNYRVERSHKLSLCSEETTTQSPMKCNCKKSKCLKLYCQCFSRGSFCQGCNCDCCQNTPQFSDIRAKAIDEMLVKAAIPFGHKSSAVKGCNCKKTGCQKKYCECFNQGIPCNEYCKCSNCENCSSQSE